MITNFVSPRDVRGLDDRKSDVRPQLETGRHQADSPEYASPFIFYVPLKRRRIILLVVPNGDVLSAITLSIWLYLGWLTAAEPYRIRQTEVAKTMQHLHQNRDRAANASLRILFAYGVERYRSLSRSVRVVKSCIFALSLLGWAAVSYFFTPVMVSAFPVMLFCTLARMVIKWQKELSSIGSKLQDVIITGHKNRTKGLIFLLIDAMEFRDGAIANRARHAVIDILPRFKEGDASLPGDRQHICLNRALHRSNPELILAVLHAMEQIGSRKAMPHVRRLTRCPLWVIDSGRISLAAKRCLTALTSRDESEQASRVLLRSVTQSSMQSDSLRSDSLLRHYVDPSKAQSRSTDTMLPFESVASGSRPGTIARTGDEGQKYETYWQETQTIGVAEDV